MVDHSEDAGRVLAELVHKVNGPEWLYAEWRAGRVADKALAFVIPHAWTRYDWPEAMIGAEAWVAMFRAAGYVCEPNNLPAPIAPFVAYRGTSEHRSRGMAWTTEMETARHFRDRYQKLGKAAFVYVVTIQPSAVLARFGSRQESEIVVDPQYLTDITRLP